MPTTPTKSRRWSLLTRALRRETRLSHRQRPDGRPGAAYAARSRHGASRLEPSVRRASRLVGRRTRRTRRGETEKRCGHHGTPVRQLNVAAQDRPALDLRVHPLRGRPGDHRPRCRLRAILRGAAQCQARGARAPKLIRQAAIQVAPSHDTSLRIVKRRVHRRPAITASTRGRERPCWCFSSARRRYARPFRGSAASWAAAYRYVEMMVRVPSIRHG